MSSIKHFCSLGTLCHTARMMQRVHIKPVSYPFDWLFTDENIIINILEDNFTKFLDKSFYCDVKNKFSDRTCGHKLYHEDFFFHKNPRNDNDYEYYLRTIDRFKKMLRDPNEKLFIITYAPEKTKHSSDVFKIFEKIGIENKKDIILNLKERAKKLNNTLINLTNNYKLLVVMNFGGNDVQSFEMELMGNIHFLTLNTLSYSNGVEFTNNNDNLFFSGIICEHYFRN